MTSEALAGEYVRLRDHLARGVAHRLRLSTDELDELYEDAWHAVLRRVRAGGQIHDLEGYLAGAIVHLWRMRLRYRRRHPAEPLDDGSPRPWSERLAAPDVPVDERMVVRERCREALKLIRYLGNPRHRRVLTLRLVCGMTAREVQTVMGVSERTYRRLLTDAMAAVDARLEERGGTH